MVHVNLPEPTGTIVQRLFVVQEESNDFDVPVAGRNVERRLAVEIFDFQVNRVFAGLFGKCRLCYDEANAFFYRMFCLATSFCVVFFFPTCVQRI